MGTGRLTAIIAFCLAACLGAAQAQSAPAAAFAELPDIDHPALSPDGTRLAFSHNSGSDRLVMILNLETGARTAVPAGSQRIEGVSWVGNRHVVVRAGSVGNMPYIRGVIDYAQLTAIDLETGQMRRLIRPLRNMGFNPDLAQVRAIDHGQGRVLIEARTQQGLPNLYWVNVQSGANTVHASGRPGTVGWVVDAGQEVVARIDRDNRGRRVVHVRRGQAFEPLSRHENAPGTSAAYGLDASGENLIVAETRRGRAASIAAIALDGSGEEAILFEDRSHEVVATFIDPYTNAVLGLQWADTVRHAHWFDAGMATLQVQLEATLDAETVTIVSWSQDRTVMLIEADYADRPVTYFLYRQRAGEPGSLQPLPSTNPAVAATRLPRRESISYLARHGESIPAYLTLPHTDGPHPFVVLPHGGPAARDYDGYDFLAHFLASRGYGVIQPNFRGSAGYGRAWRLAGHGEWGIGLMQHDLTDAVAAVVDAGLADPARICIAGASYGGYAALAGAAFTPDLYRCAISINGVSSLSRMIAYSRDRFGQGSEVLQYWRLSMTTGMEGPEAAYLQQRSPLDNAGSIQAAVLLIHGRDDSVVPVEQSRSMAATLRRRGVSVRFVEQRGGDHWLTAYQTRREVLEEMEAFLAEHLGPRPADP